MHQKNTLMSQEKVREYYGKVLQKSADLKTGACCTDGSGMSREARTALAEVNDEVKDRFYGCGSPLPPLLDGCTVLDLGCGSGRDAFVAAKLVGPGGRVIGVDMTPEQLEVANRHVASQMKRFGYAQPNISFHRGFMEDLKELGIENNSVDVVISNCVLNLSPDKPRVFSEIFRVLKPGGELYFSDVFSGRRVPSGLLEDPILHGECLAGSLYFEDFRRLLADVGCADFRYTTTRPIPITDPDIEAKIGMIDFYSSTIRAFKLPLEDRCEDYGEVATYNGTIPGNRHSFDLDDHHRFFSRKPTLVCGNTADMLQKSRYGAHFEVVGDRSTHYGLFDCHSRAATVPSADAPGGTCC